MTLLLDSIKSTISHFYQKMFTSLIRSGRSWFRASVMMSMHSAHLDPTSRSVIPISPRFNRPSFVYKSKNAFKSWQPFIKSIIASQSFEEYCYDWIGINLKETIRFCIVPSILLGWRTSWMVSLRTELNYRDHEQDRKRSKRVAGLLFRLDPMQSIDYTRFGLSSIQSRFSLDYRSSW